MTSENEMWIIGIGRYEMEELFDVLFDDWTPPNLQLADSYIEPLPSEMCYNLDPNGETAWQLK